MRCVEDVSFEVFTTSVAEKAGTEISPDIEAFLREFYMRNAKRSLTSGIRTAANYVKSLYTGNYAVLGCTTQRSGLVFLVQNEEGATSTMTDLNPSMVGKKIHAEGSSDNVGRLITRSFEEIGDLDISEVKTIGDLEEIDDENRYTSIVFTYEGVVEPSCLKDISDHEQGEPVTRKDMDEADDFPLLDSGKVKMVLYLRDLADEEPPTYVRIYFRDCPVEVFTQNGLLIEQDFIDGDLDTIQRTLSDARLLFPVTIGSRGIKEVPTRDGDVARTYNFAGYGILPLEDETDKTAKDLDKAEKPNTGMTEKTVEGEEPGEVGVGDASRDEKKRLALNEIVAAIENGVPEEGLQDRMKEKGFPLSKDNIAKGVQTLIDEDRLERDADGSLKLSGGEDLVEEFEDIF